MSTDESIPEKIAALRAGAIMVSMRVLRLYDDGRVATAMMAPGQPTRILFSRRQGSYPGVQDAAPFTKGDRVIHRRQIGRGVRGDPYREVWATGTITRVSRGGLSLTVQIDDGGKLIVHPRGCIHEDPRKRESGRVVFVPDDEPPATPPGPRAG
jgi:hypothetical protein